MDYNKLKPVEKHFCTNDDRFISDPKLTIIKKRIGRYYSYIKSGQKYTDNPSPNTDPKWI